MSVSIILGSSVVFVVLCVLVRLYGRFLYLTAKVPGPSLWDFVFVHVKELLSDNLVYHVHKISMAYKHRPWGMWTMRGFVVVVSDCETVGDVYKSKSLYKKPNMFYDQMSWYLGRGLLTLNGEEYKHHRKLAGPAFRKSAVESHLPQVNILTAQWMEKLRQVPNQEDVDMRTMVREHVGGMSAYFLAEGHLPADRIIKVMEVLEEGLVEITLESINPVYYYLWHRLKPSTRALEKKIRWLIKERDRIYDEEKRRAVQRRSTYIGKKPSCALDVMMLHYFDRGEDDMVDVEGRAEISTILAASQDTTSFCMNTCLVAFALHPEVQKRIHEEIDGIFEGTLRPVEHEDLAQLNYLEMAIKEALRIFPPAPIIGREAEDDVVIGGVTVPKGSTVLINILALHRNPDIYKDPLKYDPLRFSPEFSECRNSYAYIPFSAGFRNCPGQLQAWIMLRTSLCYILREFQVLPGTGTNSIDDIKPPMNFTFHMPKFPVRFVKRTN